MNRPSWKLAGAVAVAAGVLSLSYLAAQPPEGGPPDGPGRGFKGKFGPRDDRDKAPSRVDREVEEWVRMLAEKIADRHDEIRDSARAALAAVGPAALPTLRRLADGPDGATATAARKVIARIEHHGPPGPAGLFAFGAGFGGPPPFGRRDDDDRPGPRRGPPEKGDRPGPGGPPEKADRRPGGPPEKADRPNRPDGPPRGGPDQLGRALRALDLSDDQRQRVEAVVKSQQDKLQRIRDRVRDGELEPEEARATARREMESVREKLKDILTTDQFRRFESEMRPPSGPAEKGPRPPQDN